MKKLALITLSVLTASTLLAKEVKVGVIMPLTGALAGYGQMTKKGVDLANEMKHTLKNGDNVKLVYVDNAGDKAQTANAVNKLNNQGVVAIIGALTSSNSLVVAPIVKREKIPTVAPVATNKMVTRANPYMNRACFIDPFQGKVAAKYAYNSLHAKTAVVVIDKSQAYSVGLAKAFMQNYAKLGGKIVKRVFITSGDKDFKAVLSTIKSANPDIIYAPIYAPEMALMAKQAKMLGIKKPILGGDGLSDETLRKVAKDAANGIMYTDHFNEKATPTKLSKEFVAKYHKKYKESVPSFAANGADSYFIIFNAMNKCDKITRECIAKNITKTKNLEGVTGKITIPASGNPKKSAVINEIQNGKIEYKATVNP